MTVPAPSLYEAPVDLNTLSAHVSDLLVMWHTDGNLVHQAKIGHNAPINQIMIATTVWRELAA
jgi:hypothetical protein